MSYVMDDPREAERLAAKVNPEHWVASCLARYLATARSVLDVGCGPGVIMRAVSRLAPQSQVCGVDTSVHRVEAGRRLNAENPRIEIYQGTAARLPFEENRFDLVYCRCLLQHIAERAEAVAEMMRVCRPGGVVLLQDLDGQFLWHFPVDPYLEEGTRIVLDCLAKAGFDPFVGRKLFSLMRHAGLSQLEVQAESYHLIAGTIDERNHALWKLKFDIALPAFAQAIGGMAAAEALRDEFLSYLRRDDSLTYSVMFTVTGVKPDGCTRSRRSEEREHEYGAS